MRLAVLDLGTNTFHLLIAERDSNCEAHFLSKNKIYVKLAEEGIGHIGEAAFQRGLDALRTFKAELDTAGVSAANTRALGTAALRTADNASDFLQQATEILGIRPEIVPGEREAELIQKGVRQAVPFPIGKRVLIMDIGGGSVEFVIADRERVFWQKSFPVGVAVLWRRFHHSDPIEQEEVQQIEQYLETALDELWQAIARHPSSILVGASGTFDVIDLFLLDPAEKPELYGYIPVMDFYPLYKLLLRSTLAERRAMLHLPAERAEMVVAALVLIRVVLKKIGVGEIYTSVYAMKEGMLAEMLEVRGER